MKISSNIVQMEVPCDIEAGFTFLADYNSKTFPVQVPPGGVRTSQQRLQVPRSTNFSESTPFFQSRDEEIGHWKDSIFDCCAYGPCHPSFLHAVFCPQILMAQVLTRLKLNWCGNRAPEHEWKQTFVLVVRIVAYFWVLTVLLAPSLSGRIKDASTDEYVRAPLPLAFQSMAYNLLHLGFGAYTVYVLMKLRRAVRQLRNVSTSIWEDFCCAFWCGSCLVSQLARETCDYDHDGASLVTSTGVQRSSAVLEVLTV